MSKTQEVAFSSARWIGMSAAARGRAAVYFRHEFEVKGEIISARLNICGLGYFEAALDGGRVGDHVLDPVQADYESRCFYVAHDVTSQVRPGRNAIGVIVGDGWFNQDLVWDEGKGRLTYGEPRLLAQLEIQMAGGERLIVATDETWRCSTGPITNNNIYAGECYDARLEMSGWDSVGFDEARWRRIEEMPAPGGRLEEQRIEPIKIIEELSPVSMVEPRPGCWVVDMGQNFSGWARIRVEAPAGTAIKMRFAETIFPDGMIDMASTGIFATKVEQTDVYMCKGGGVETWEPRFTYHGFRYIEITGWPGKPALEAIKGEVVHTALARAGAFECSDARLNLLHQMALWTHRSNIHGLPEDCPVRERCGWLGDAHIVCEYSIYNFQGLAFWEKYLGDIETTRALYGGLPNAIAPGKRTCGPASSDWMAALILLPWYLHVYYGTRTVLERHWEGMRTVMENFKTKADDWILKGGLGDWCDPRVSTFPVHTLPDLTTTIWFHECARIMREVAMRLEHPRDAERYASWMGHIREAFQKKFYDPAKNTFGSQTADAMALRFGLVPKDCAKEVVQSLVRDIRETHDLHHTIGIMGLRYLFEELSRNGEGDTALALLHQDTYPSFGDLIQRGATTLWEYWGEAEVDLADGPRSLNHPMMGGFDNWFYNTLAGLRPDPDQPGFKHFFLEPRPIQGLEWVRVHHDSPHGRIVSEWRIEKEEFLWDIVVPPGTTATVTLPHTGEIREVPPGAHHYKVCDLFRPVQKDESSLLKKGKKKTPSLASR